MKIKKSFMKVVLLNELLNIHCSNQTLILKDFLIHFKLLYPNYLINKTFHDSHAIKVAPHKQM